MCSAGHAWVGLGRIVYAASDRASHHLAQQLGAARGAVSPLPITAVAPGLPVGGPAPELAEELRELHHRQATR